MDGIMRSIPARVAYVSGEDNRQARRRIVSFAATVGTGLGEAEDVEVLDLSEKGFRIRSDAPAERGTNLLIQLPGTEPVRARVVWCDDGQIGCAFEEELHSATIDLIVGRKRLSAAKPVQRRSQFGLRLAR